MNWTKIMISFAMVTLAYFASISSAASTTYINSGAINRDGLTSPPMPESTNVFSKSTFASTITDGIKSIIGTDDFHRMGRAAFGQFGLNGSEALKVLVFIKN